MTQGELEKLPAPIGRAFSELETRIMTDIVRRIKINGFSTDSADWQMTRLQQLGASEAEIKKWVQEALEISDEEVEHIFSDEVYEQYMGHSRAYKARGIEHVPFEENMALQQLLDATKRQISGEYGNLAASMGFAIRGTDGRIQYSPLLDYYRSTLDAAIVDIQSGAFDYQTVLSRTVNQMTSSGLRWIDYNSGVHNRVDVAARRAVLTGFRQVQGHINEQVAADLGTDSYEVTYHVGARPEHQVWQGKVWTMKQLREVCGLGTVTGLHGANCYHDYNAFIPGVSVRTYTDKQLNDMMAEENRPKEYLGKKYTTYEALQHQRKMETTMRKYRQDVALMQRGGADEKDIVLKKGRYQGTMQEYNAFSKAMNLPVQKNRIFQDGLSINMRAKPIAKSPGSGIIKIQKKDIEKGTTKLKGAMSDKDYAAYLDKLNNHKNQYIKKLYAGFADGITDIKLGSGGCYYPGGNNIVFSYPDQHYIDNGKSKYSTIAHEYGHYFDAKGSFSGLNFKEIDTICKNTQYGKSFFKKCASSSDEFLAAARKDREYLKGKLTKELKDELGMHDSSDGVQDAIEGLLGVRINWGHGDRYYNRKYSSVKDVKDQKGLQKAYKELGIDASNQTKVKQECRTYEAASEMWANIMEAEVNGGDSLKYVKDYLPNSYQAMIDILKGGA